MITANGKPANALPVSASPVTYSSSSWARRLPGRWSAFALWYGYDASAKAQSASAMNGIMLLFTVIPGVGYLITAGVVRLLKVDRELMKNP